MTWRPDSSDGIDQDRHASGGSDGSPANNLRQMAEGVGFEPTETLQPQKFSRFPQSTTLPPFRDAVHILLVELDEVPPVLRDDMVEDKAKLLAPDHD
jgi:hypothetical protein